VLSRPASSHSSARPRQGICDATRTLSRSLPDCALTDAGSKYTASKTLPQSALIVFKTAAFHTPSHRPSALPTHCRPRWPNTFFSCCDGSQLTVAVKSHLQLESSCSTTISSHPHRDGCAYDLWRVSDHPHISGVC
jgi:hypothetical protein